jgi:hypothetical protein
MLAVAVLSCGQSRNYTSASYMHTNFIKCMRILGAISVCYSECLYSHLMSTMPHLRKKNNSWIKRSTHYQFLILPAILTPYFIHRLKESNGLILYSPNFKSFTPCIQPNGEKNFWGLFHSSTSIIQFLIS